MASLNGNRISDTYTSLLKTVDNSTVDTTSKNITDGAGNATALSISTTSVTVSGSLVLSGSLVVANAATLAITASNAISASVATSSSFATSASQAISSSYALSTPLATSALNAATASNVLGGTENYLPIWSSSTQVSSSIVYQSGSKVGIGTTTLAATLDISGSLKVSSGSITLPGLVALNFTNDTAASASGVPVGGLYRSGSVVMIRVV